MDPFYASLYATLEKAKLATGCTDEQWGEALGMDPRQYKKIYKTYKPLSPASVDRLAKFLGVAPDRLVVGDVDLKALAWQFAGNRMYIPERYKVAAFSRQRTALNLIKFFERALGETNTDRVLRYLQIHKQALQPDEPINMLLGADLLTVARPATLEIERRYNVDVHYDMGTSLIPQIKASPFGQELSVTRSCGELYEQIIWEYIDCFETNCRYAIETLTENYCLISCKPKDIITDALNTKRLGTPEICSYKRGLIAAYPELIGLDRATVVETHCIHRGDPECRFAVNFPVERNSRPLPV